MSGRLGELGGYGSSRRSMAATAGGVCYSVTGSLPDMGMATAAIRAGAAAATEGGGVSTSAADEEGFRRSAGQQGTAGHSSDTDGLVRGAGL